VTAALEERRHRRADPRITVPILRDLRPMRLLKQDDAASGMPPTGIDAPPGPAID
jgi:hypothetical protein